jgi:ribosomal protein L37AE/L43A
MTKMDDLERQRELRRLRDEALNTPNCPACLHRMEPAEVDDDLVWACPECGARSEP